MSLFGLAGIGKAGSSTEPKIAIWFYEVGVWAFFFFARLVKKGLNFFLRLLFDHLFTTVIIVRVNHCEFDGATRSRENHYWQRSRHWRSFSSVNWVICALRGRLFSVVITVVQ